MSVFRKLGDIYEATVTYEFTFKQDELPGINMDSLRQFLHDTFDKDIDKLVAAVQELQEKYDADEIESAEALLARNEAKTSPGIRVQDSKRRETPLEGIKVKTS